MRSSRVILDANVFVAFLSKEPHYQLALSLWQALIEADEIITAPLLLRYEVTSVLFRKAMRGFLTKSLAQEALTHFNELDISWFDPPGLSQRAFELAVLFNRPNTYDAHYLALAEYLDCPLWTGDKRLYNAVHERFPLIRWLGN